MRKIYIFLSIVVFSGFYSVKAQTTNHPTSGTATTNQCGGNYYDPGGSGLQYGNNRNSLQTICPSVAGQYVRIQFTSFATENLFDYLTVFDGNTSDAPVVGTYCGATLPPTITASDPSGCLSFRFFSDGGTQFNGWQSTISCVASPGPVPAASPQDCGGGQGITICSNSSFAGNSGGQGAVDELLGDGGSTAVTYSGCIDDGEHQSSWYYFSPSASGTIGFVISPTNGTDDYDFAVWGPSGSGTPVPCPAFTGNAPLRCSYSALGGNTGCQAPAVDLTEGSGGDKFVAPFAVIAGERYVLLIDNFNSTSFPFNLNWTFGGGASLDCTPLPIVLEQFNGKAKDHSNLVYWTTSTEINNHYFIVEKSEDAVNWIEMGRMNGVGNSNVQNTYSMYDPVPYKTTYYRLSQTDFNGTRLDFSPIVVERNDNGSQVGEVFGFYPNPASGMVNVQTFDEGENVLFIRDQAGKTVFTTIINGKTIQTINFDNTVHNGLYFITIQNGEKLQNEKIIIAK